MTRSVAAESHETLSIVVSRPDLAHQWAVVAGPASVITNPTSPSETRSKARAPA